MSEEEDDVLMIICKYCGKINFPETELIFDEKQGIYYCDDCGAEICEDYGGFVECKEGCECEDCRATAAENHYEGLNDYYD